MHSLSILMAISRWTLVSRYLLKQRMMDVVMTTGAVNHAKLQSNHHHQQTNTQFFYSVDALPVTQPTVSKHWREKYHILYILCRKCSVVVGLPLVFRQDFRRQWLSPQSWTRCNENKHQNTQIQQRMQRCWRFISHPFALGLEMGQYCVIVICIEEFRRPMALT